ncbi:MAG: YciI family protein [Gemmatimonadota bacterium]
MQYMLLIYSNEEEWDKLSPEVMGEWMGEYNAFTDSIVKSGNYKAGEPLQPTTTATTVRVRDGKTQITDGPFAETREQLGGFYWVEAKDLDQALQIAARIPSARVGSVEVRPIMPMEKMPTGAEADRAVQARR